MLSTHSLQPMHEHWIQLKRLNRIGEPQQFLIVANRAESELVANRLVFGRPHPRMLGLEAHYRSFVVGKGHTDTVRSPSDIHLATMGYEVEKSEEQWRAELGERYDVLREAATERAWTGELLDEERDGLYRCGACGNELFQSGTKFDSGCGWPSFYDAVNPEAVELLEDTSLGMTRTEVRCAKCGSHLGHVFPDGFGTPTGLRFCMNSLALNFDADA